MSSISSIQGSLRFLKAFIKVSKELERARRTRLIYRCLEDRGIAIFIVKKILRIIKYDYSLVWRYNHQWSLVIYDVLVLNHNLQCRFFWFYV